MLNKFYKLIIFSFFISLGFPVLAQDAGSDFSEIRLDASVEKNYFIDAVKTENVNFIDKNKLELDFNGKTKGQAEININEKSSIDFNIEETDEDNVFTEKSEHSLDIKTDLSQKLTDNINLNSDISLKNLNNRTDGSASISNFNLSTEIIPKHKLYFGQVSICDDNTPSLALFSEIKNDYDLTSLKSTDDIDLKIAKESGFINYSAGIYNLNSTETDLHENNSVTGGWTAFNPLYKHSKAGSLQVGGGYFTNQYAVKNKSNREDTYSVFSGYKYRRFSVRGEYLRKDNAFYEGQYSDSWYFVNKVAVTKKLDFKTGFKQYEETGKTVNDVGFEYSPFAEKERLKLELNASFIKTQQNNNKDSKRLNIKTKYFF